LPQHLQEHHGAGTLHTLFPLRHERCWVLRNKRSSRRCVLS
jgi:hypothetical protein